MKEELGVITVLLHGIRKSPMPSKNRWIQAPAARLIAIAIPVVPQPLTSFEYLVARTLTFSLLG